MKECMYVPNTQRSILIPEGKKVVVINDDYSLTELGVEDLDVRSLTIKVAWRYLNNDESNPNVNKVLIQRSRESLKRYFMQPEFVKSKYQTVSDILAYLDDEGTEVWEVIDLSNLKTLPVTKEKKKLTFMELREERRKEEGNFFQRLLGGFSLLGLCLVGETVGLGMILWLLARIAAPILVVLFILHYFHVI